MREDEKERKRDYEQTHIEKEFDSDGQRKRGKFLKTTLMRFVLKEMKPQNIILNHKHIFVINLFITARLPLWNMKVMQSPRY